MDVTRLLEEGKALNPNFNVLNPEYVEYIHSGPVGKSPKVYIVVVPTETEGKQKKGDKD